MSKDTIETRGRPRDAVYTGIANTVLAYVKRYPSKRRIDMEVDIRNPRSRVVLRNRYLAFRQSSTFRELRERLRQKGYSLSLFLVDGETVTLKVSKNG